MDERIQILLTNDDGIQSPGLWAAAAALSKLGYVTVAAPRDQASSTGRSLPRVSEGGRIEQKILRINDQQWPVYAVGGTPAQVVLHALLEIMPGPPHLVVSGINYGENLGTSVTISGTVGAAMEGAARRAGGEWQARPTADCDGADEGSATPRSTPRSALRSCSRP